MNPQITIFIFQAEISTGRAVGPGESNAEIEEAAVGEVHGALCNYITLNPEIWAPIVSSWSLQLLGELSTRYAGRAHIPIDSGNILRLTSVLQY